jgi:hypothetical protein
MMKTTSLLIASGDAYAPSKRIANPLEHTGHIFLIIKRLVISEELLVISFNLHAIVVFI